MENKQNIKDLIHKFYPHAKEKLGFDHPVRVIMRQDAENAQQSLGKTAYYDPAEKLIVLYVTNRHPKDVLRSFSHELVHHAQNCRGELDDLSTDAHYAKDGKGREIEKEAYLQGNLNLRDYEDSIKFEEPNHMDNIKEQNELEDIIGADKLYDGPRDKNKIPLEKPPLKKDWKKDPIGRKQRADFRKWYTTYGPGSKQKDSGAGMTSPEGPATDDPSLDYQTKLPPKDPWGLEKWKTMRPAMSRKEWIDTYHATLPGRPISPEDAMKDLAKAKDEERMQDAIKIEKALAQLDVNAFRTSYSEYQKDREDFDASFSSKAPHVKGATDELGADYRHKMRQYAKHRTGTDSGLARDALKKQKQRDALKKQKQNEGVNKVKLTKSQLKGLIEQTIKKITEGGAKPDFLDLDKDGNKNEPMAKAAEEAAAVNEESQQMDMNAIANVLAELRQLENLDHEDSCVDGCHDPDSYLSVFASLADKLEKAMKGQVAALGSSGELEEQEEVEEGTQPPEEKGDETAEFLDGMIQKRLRKKKRIPKNPADLVQPVSPIKLEESNDTWYNSSLYESLKTKWTKKGDK